MRSARVISSPAGIISRGADLRILFPWVYFASFNPTRIIFQLRCTPEGACHRARLMGCCCLTSEPDVSKTFQSQINWMQWKDTLPFVIRSFSWNRTWLFSKTVLISFLSVPPRMKLVPISSTETPRTLGQSLTTWGMENWCWTRTWQRKVMSLSWRIVSARFLHTHCHVVGASIKPAQPLKALIHGLTLQAC